MKYPNLSIKVIRDYCLECCAGERAYVLWCGCQDCQLWPYRFGVQPNTFQKRWGPRLLTPEMMPDSSVLVDDLPKNVKDAATQAIEVEGYSAPEIVLKKRVVTPEDAAKTRARFTKKARVA